MKPNIQKHDIRLFEQVTIPRAFLQSLKTGISDLDGFLSVQGGLVPSMSYMFTGVSGSGKTTISNYIMSGISTEANPAVFVSLEMSMAQAKYQFDGKVDFSHTYIVDTIKDPTLKGFRALLYEISQKNPSVVVFDSLQAIALLLYGDPRSERGQSEIAKKVIEFSKKTGCPTILIGQCNKDGSYSGPSSIKHFLDAHLHASIDKKTGQRSLAFEKNRFGNVGQSLSYKFLDDGGLSFKQEENIQTKLVGRSIEWKKAEDVIAKLHGEIIASEWKLLKDKPIPSLKFKGRSDVDKGDLNFHPKQNAWANGKKIKNTIFIDIEESMERFQSSDVLEDYEEYINRYKDAKDRPIFNTPNDLFYLDYLLYMTYALNLKADKDKKFWDILDRLVKNFA